MDIYKSIQENLNSQRSQVREVLPPTFEEIKDEIEKAKGAQQGEIREWGGKKYQKGPNGWRPVKKEKGAGKEEEGGEEQQVTPEALAEHAKGASESALLNATKISKDPAVREAAHKELLRRKNEEAQETFKAPDVDENGKPLSEEAKNGKKLFAEEKQKAADKKFEDGAPENKERVDKVNEKIKDEQPAEKKKEKLTPISREEKKQNEGSGKSFSTEDEKDIDWIKKLVAGGHLDMAKKEIGNLDTAVREKIPKSIYNKAMGINEEKVKENIKSLKESMKKMDTDNIEMLIGMIKDKAYSDVLKEELGKRKKEEKEAIQSEEEMLDDAAEKGVVSFDWKDEDAAVEAFEKLAKEAGLKVTEHPAEDSMFILSKRKLTDRQLEVMEDDPYDYPTGTEVFDLGDGDLQAALDSFKAAMKTFGHEVKDHPAFEDDEFGVYLDTPEKNKKKEEKPKEDQKKKELEGREGFKRVGWAGDYSWSVPDEYRKKVKDILKPDGDITDEQLDKIADLFEVDRKDIKGAWNRSTMGSRYQTVLYKGDTLAHGHTTI